MSDEEDFLCEEESEEEEEDEEDEGMDDGIHFSGEEDEADGGGQKHQIATNYQVLTPDQISKKMFEIIDEVNAVFQVSYAHIHVLSIS